MQPGTMKKESTISSNAHKDQSKNRNVRLTDFKSVAKLIERFNQSDQSITQKQIEVEVRDVLDRIAKLSLQSSILDTARIDPIRVSLKAVKKPDSSDTMGQDKTRSYAAQARISLVAYAACKTLHLRDKALDILLEALDTNILSFDRSESNALLQLITQLTKALQFAIDKARSEDPAQMRVAVDNHLERLLKALMLSIQRIEYFVDMESLVLTPEFSDSLHNIYRELDMFRTDDPHIVCQIFTMHEGIKWIIFKTNSVESDDEAATLRIALSFVSNVIRMAPPSNISQLQGAFEAILDDLNSKSKWFLGTAAMYHVSACKLFLGVLRHLRTLHWQWMYQALLTLGTIVLTAECSQTRKLAFEEGVLNYTSFGDASDQSVGFHKYTWTSRAACAITLNHILKQRKSSPIGILAHSAINARKVQESHNVVLDILKNNGHSDVNRLSVLFKYTGRNLGEDYSESLDKLADFKKHIAYSSSISKKPVSKKYKRLEIMNQDLNNLKLSVDAYHSNYKKHPSLLNQHKTIDSQLKITTKPSSLSNSYSCNTATEKNIPQITIPTAGTANRRKLFNPELTSSNSEGNPDSEPSDFQIQVSECDSESINSLSKGIIVIPALKY